MIEVTKEQETDRCLFCGHVTRYWHCRTITAVCSDCADDYSVDEILLINGEKDRYEPIVLQQGK